VGPDRFLASLDRRALNWLRAHPHVAYLERLDPATAARLAASVDLGGREDSGPMGTEPSRGWTDTRILINGAIAGWNVSGYQQPFISAAGNLFGDAAEILRAFDYAVGFSNNAFVATRNDVNAAGSRRIELWGNSATIRTISASGVSSTFSLAEATRVQNGKLMAPIRRLIELAGAAIIDWDADTRSLQAYYYERLDTGIYFYGVQQNGIRTDQPGAQKYIPGQPNPFFDPTRPTILYAHGWQKGGVVNRGREGFLLTSNGQWQNVQNYWITRGWNVGIFHWVQLADDDWGAMPVDTEKKIYDANARGVGMRWKRTDGSFSPNARPTLNVTQIYRAAYLQVAAALSGGVEIRLIGNSLGGNLSTAMGRELAINGSRLPIRITLQDPYWDPSLNQDDGITVPGGLADTRAVGADGAARLSNAGVALEYYRTSFAGEQGYNRRVAEIASYVNYVPDWAQSIAERHTQPFKVYLWAFDFAGTVASPRTPHATIRGRMNSQDYWDQVGGRGTATPGDDTYVTRNGKPR
jgi:hypothetical protein